jgi:hypothetical protein
VRIGDGVETALSAWTVELRRIESTGLSARANGPVESTMPAKIAGYAQNQVLTCGSVERVTRIELALLAWESAGSPQSGPLAWEKNQGGGQCSYWCFSRPPRAGPLGRTDYVVSLA